MTPRCSPAGERGDHGEQDGDLDADGPDEVAGDLLIESVDPAAQRLDRAAELRAELRAAAIDFGVEGVDPPLEPIEPTVESLHPAFQFSPPVRRVRTPAFATLSKVRTDLGPSQPRPPIR